MIVRLCTCNDVAYAKEITDEMESSAIARGSGIAKRSPQSIADKMTAGKAVIALTSDHHWVGFSYFDVWDNGHLVSNGGLIVSPEYRHSGVARKIKETVFGICRKNYPEAKIFSITSGLAIMKMNTALGFEPVTYSEITHDEHFWVGCKSCVNYHVLEGKKRCNCLCTAMLFDPARAN